MARKATLGDLQRTRVNVIVELADGEEVEIGMRSLSYFTYNAIRWSVPNPTPPTVGADKQGKPIYGYNEPAFQQAVAEAEMKRTYKLLLASVDMELPGDSEDDRLRYLQDEVDAAVVRQLVNVLQQIATRGEARIAARADSFPAGSPAAGVDAGALAPAPDTAAVERATG